MAKIILQFEESPLVKKGDVIIYNGKHYATLSKAAFLKDLIEKIKALQNYLTVAYERIEDLEHQLQIDHGEVE